MRLRWVFNILMFCIVVCSYLILESVFWSLFLIVNLFSKLEFMVFKVVLWVVLGVLLGVMLGVLFGIDRLYILLFELFIVERLFVDVFVEVFVEVLEFDSGFEWDLELNFLEVEERMIGMLFIFLLLIIVEFVMVLCSFICFVNSIEMIICRGRCLFEVVCMYVLRDRVWMFIILYSFWCFWLFKVGWNCICCFEYVSLYNKLIVWLINVRKILINFKILIMEK